MPHIAISCPPLPGHINPFCVLGRELVRRGHKVTLLGMVDTEQMMQNQGIGFCPIAQQQAPRGSLTPLWDALKEQRGFRGTLFAIRAAAQLMRLILEYAPAALERENIDAVLTDQNEPALATVSEYLGLPFASICTSLPINREAQIPPPFSNWNYSAAPTAKLRNRFGYKVSDLLTRDLQATLNEYRQRWGLAPLRSPNDSFSKVAQIAQMPMEFDFPRRAISSPIEYTGPWIDDASDRGLLSGDFPYDKLDGRPILYASLGTLQSSNSKQFEVIAEACCGLALQVVISVGARPGDPLPKLAGDHIVVRFAPQIELLKGSRLTITHAGMNTTMHALHFGIPLIAIPLAHDQPAIAARLQRTGAGIVLSARDLTASKLRNAIEQILQKDSPWQMEAKRMQLSIAKAGGVARAADIVEQKVIQLRAASASA